MKTRHQKHTLHSVLNKKSLYFSILRLLRAQWGQPNLTLQQKIALGVAAPILIPLGVVAGVILLPVAAGRAIRNKIHDVRLLREYRENKLDAMSTMTEEVSL